MGRLSSHEDAERLDSVYSENFTIEKFMPGLDIPVIFISIIILHVLGIFPVQSSYPIPNPFWIAVILGAVQYGTGPGLVCVVVATGLDWMMGGSASDLQSDYYAYLLNHLREPILWFLAVGVLGGIRQKQFDTTEELVEEAGERQAQAAALAQQCGALRQEVARLEHAVAVSGPGNAGLSLELLGELVAAPPHRLEETFRHVLDQLIGAEGIELVLFDNVRPRPLPEGNISVLRPSFPLRVQGVPPLLVDALVSSSRPLSCVRAHDAAYLADAAMAAPIPGLAGEILGVVLVREVDPDCLCEAGEAALSLSCFILGKRVTQARETAAETAPTGLPARVQFLQSGNAVVGLEN